MSRCRMIVLVVVLLSIAGVRGQQPAPIAPSLTQYEFIYLGDERLRAELKLKPESFKRIPPLWNGAIDDLLNGRRDAARHNKANQEQERELDAALDKDQRARLRQIILQHLARVPAGPEIIAADAGLVKHLNLSDDQVKQLKERKPLADVLDAGQQKTWKDLTGQPYPRWLVLRCNSLTPWPPPRELRTLYADRFAAEIKLTAAQQEQIDDLLWQWSGLFPDVNTRIKELDAASADFVKKAQSVLDAGQRARLEQFLLQVDASQLGQRSIYELPAVIKALAVSKEQQEKITARRRANRSGQLALFLAGDAPEALRGKLKQHETEAQQLLDAEVTAEQRAKVKELLGTPLPAGMIGRIVGLPLPYEQAATPPTKRPVTVYLPTYAGLPAVHQMLNVNADTGKKLAELAKEFTRNRFSDDEAEERKQGAAIDARLAEILEPAKIKQLKQIAVRNWPLMGSLTWPVQPQLLAVEEVSAGLKLTPAQLKRIERGAYLDEVLDDTQRQAWTELAGKPAPQPPPPKGPVIIMPPSYPYESLLLMQLVALGDASVQKELKLTEDQQKLVANEVKKMPARSELPAMPADAAGRKQWLANIEKQGRAILAPLVKQLDPAQRKRLQQIALQQCGQYGYPSGRVGLLSLPEVGFILELKDEQQSKLAAARSDYLEVELLLRGLPDPEFPQKGDDRYVTIAELQKQYEKKMTDLLSPEQQKGAIDMLGEPYRGIIRPR